MMFNIYWEVKPYISVDKRQHVFGGKPAASICCVGNEDSRFIWNIDTICQTTRGQFPEIHNPVQYIMAQLLEFLKVTAK